MQQFSVFRMRTNRILPFPLRFMCFFQCFLPGKISSYKQKRACAMHFQCYQKCLLLLMPEKKLTISNSGREDVTLPVLYHHGHGKTKVDRPALSVCLFEPRSFLSGCSADSVWFFGVTVVLCVIMCAVTGDPVSFISRYNIRVPTPENKELLWHSAGTHAFSVRDAFTII